MERDHQRGRAARPGCRRIAGAVPQVVATAVEKCRAVETGARRAHRCGGIRGARRLLALAASFSCRTLHMRHALSALRVIALQLEAAAVRIEVTPGPSTVPAAPIIRLRAAGRVPVPTTVRDPHVGPRGLRARAPDPRRREYCDAFDSRRRWNLVEAVGVRSRLHVEIPTCRRQKLELDYRFPAYKRLHPEDRSCGDIAVCAARDPRAATPTMAAGCGAIVIDDTAQVPMTVGADGR